MKSTVEKAAENAGVNSELDSLKESFSQLRTDVVDVLNHAFGLGRSSAEAAKESASDAVVRVKDQISSLKERGTDSLSNVERKIEENPLPAALIAFGAGYLIAKVLGRRH
ncbi:MAG: hypothetical protein H7144_06905 [Burkholderiales bacterium]|nr:hypothetical protein [Phycisphaerae bacterium]